MKHLFCILSFAISIFDINLFASDLSLKCGEQVEMGTPFKICVYASKENSLNAEGDIHQSFRKIREMNDWMSEWQGETELSRVNQGAGSQPVKVGRELFDLLKFTLDVSEKSSGALDPTFNAFWGLYNFKKGSEREPTNEEIAERLPLVNFKNVKLDLKAQTIFLTKPAMKLGLGAVGQGYAVKKVVEFLKSRGYASGYVDGSGDSYFWGLKPDGSLWTAAVRDPRDHDKIITKFYGTDFALTTCGDDEKFFWVGDRRVHHVIDPKTGRSASSSRQVSVVSKDPLVSDAWDTASFVMGFDKAKSVLQKLGVIGIFVTGEGEVKYSRALKSESGPWGEGFKVPDDIR